MARAIWTGTISFGLVNIPVRVFPATRRKDVRFHEIDRQTGQRIHHQRVRWESSTVEAETLSTKSSTLEADTLSTQPSTLEADLSTQPSTLEADTLSTQPSTLEADTLSTQPSTLEADNLSTKWGGQGGDIQEPGSHEVVRPNEVVKGFEISPGTFITVTPEEIEELRPERTKTIAIEEFVAAAEVDPVHFDTAYHVVPQREYERPFALLVEALEASAKLAISWIVLRKRRHLAALRPHEGVLMLSTMYFADEVVPVAEIAPRSTDKPSERELRMAALLVESMRGTFEPARYEDGYRKRLLELIASRSAQAIAAPEPAEPVYTSGVEELMAALEASLKQVKSLSRKRRAG